MCSRCGTSFAGTSKADLREVPSDWRCRPGQAPKTYELRCRGCGYLVYVYASHPDGELALLHDQRGSFERVRAREREEAFPLERRDGRDRDR